jgi:hypothetical protein
MLPILSGDVHTYAVLALQLRREALKVIVQADQGLQADRELDVSPQFFRAIFKLNQLFREQPDLVFYDPETALDLGAKIVYHRLNGDLICVCVDDNNPGTPASIKVVDLDCRVTGVWYYNSLAAAIHAANQWMLDLQGAPTGWVGVTEDAVSTPSLGHTHEYKSIA